MDVAQLGDEDHGGDKPDATQAHQGAHDGCLFPRFEYVLHLVLEARDALVGGFDGLDVFFEHDVHGRQLKGDAAQGAHAGFAPGGLVSDAVAVTQEECFELTHGAALVIDGIGSGAADIPDAFVRGIRHMHGSEFSGTVEAGELDGVAAVRLDLVAFWARDQGRGCHEAGDALLCQMPCDDESGGAGFVADAQFRSGMPELVEDRIQRTQRRWDCSIVAHFAVAAGIRSGDADRVGVDIESDIEYGSGHRHGVLAVFYLFVCAAASCRWRPNMRLCSFGNNPRLLAAGTPPSIKAGALGAGRGTGRSHRV